MLQKDLNFRILLEKKKRIWWPGLKSLHSINRMGLIRGFLACRSHSLHLDVFTCLNYLLDSYDTRHWWLAWKAQGSHCFMVLRLEGPIMLKIFHTRGELNWSWLKQQPQILIRPKRSAPQTQLPDRGKGTAFSYKSKDYL